MHEEICKQEYEIKEILNNTRERFHVLVNEYENKLHEKSEAINFLAEQNLSLEIRVAELKILVDDLENLLDVNNQLQSLTNEIDLELQEECYVTKFVALRHNLDILLQSKKYYEETIRNLQNKVKQLNETNFELNIQLQEERSKVSKLITIKRCQFSKEPYIVLKTLEMQKLVDLNTAEMHEFNVDINSIEMQELNIDLKSLEIQECKQYVNYLRAFMPDIFFSKGSDHDAILVLLLIFRMVSKVKILISGVKKRFYCPKVITKHSILDTGEVCEFAFGNRLLYQLYLLQAILDYFKLYCDQCSAELLMKIASRHVEMAPQECVVDSYIDLLRNDQLNENNDSLSKCTSYFYNLINEHHNSERDDYDKLITDEIELIEIACISIHTDITIITVLFENFHDYSELKKMLNEALTYFNNILESVRCIRKFLPAILNNPILEFVTYIQNFLYKYKVCTGKAMCGTYFLRNVAIQTITSESSSHSSIYSSLKEFIFEYSNEIFGKDCYKLTSLKKSGSKIRNLINLISNNIQNDEEKKNINARKIISPVHIRAELFKNKLKNLESLNFKLEWDLIDYKKKYRTKSEELKIIQIRQEMSQKKYANTIKDYEEQLYCIKKVLDETPKMNKKVYKQSVYFQTFIDLWGTEKLEETIMEDKNEQTEIVQMNSTDTDFFNDILLLKQVQNLQLALKHIMNENQRLRNDKLMKQLACLKPLKVPQKTVFNNVKFDDKINSIKHLVHLARKTKNLMKEGQLLSCPLVVDISNRIPGQDNSIAAESSSVLQQNHVFIRNHKLKSLEHKIQKLKSEVAMLKTAKTFNSPNNICLKSV